MWCTKCDMDAGKKRERRRREHTITGTGMFTVYAVPSTMLTTRPIPFHMPSLEGFPLTTECPYKTLLGLVDTRFPWALLWEHKAHSLVASSTCPSSCSLLPQKLLKGGC